MSSGTESVEESVEEWTEPDGTRVIKTVITTRTKPVYETVEPSAMSDFERTFLEKHNQYRALHRVPPLALSREMCNYAQEWADQSALQNKMLQRPSPKRFGENLFKKSSTSMRISGEEPVRNWYERCKDYSQSWYGAEPPQSACSKCGNFTQIVWKATERLGVAFALNGNTFYVVANYDPPGNFITQYAINVLPPNKN